MKQNSTNCIFLRFPILYSVDLTEKIYSFWKRQWRQKLANIILNKVRVSIFAFNWLVFINKIVVYYTMLCVHHVCSSLLRVWTCHFDFSFQLRGDSLTTLTRGGGYVAKKYWLFVNSYKVENVNVGG